MRGTNVQKSRITTDWVKPKKRANERGEAGDESDRDCCRTDQKNHKHSQYQEKVMRSSLPNANARTLSDLQKKTDNRGWKRKRLDKEGISKLACHHQKKTKL